MIPSDANLHPKFKRRAFLRTAAFAPSASVLGMPGLAVSAESQQDHPLTYSKPHVDLAHLPAELCAPARPLPGGSFLALAVRDFERALVRDCLVENGWSRTCSARALGITRRALFNKMARHRLAPPTRAASARR